MNIDSLSSYRVLDLSDKGLICGQILADLGADVIQIEPPAGSRGRFVGPFQTGIDAPENSLHWQAYTRNKRSVVLDLESAEGQDIFRNLVRDADFLIESEPPGAMTARGIGYESLSEINPALVYVSITAFGQKGPKAHHAATDLTILAAAGWLNLNGDRDRAPVRISVPQAFHHAGAEAAVGALLAHHQRLKSGLGQQVDISAQESVTLATQSNTVASTGGDTPFERWAGGMSVGPMTIRNVYPAKDGYVTITHIFGSTVGPATRRLMEYVYDEGFCDEATRDKDWVRYFELIASGEEPLEEFERVKQIVAELTSGKTKQELFAAAQERRLLLAPIASIDEILVSNQLRSRDYFTEVKRGDLTSRYPGPFAKFSESEIRYQRPSPYLGEHTNEVLTENRSAAKYPVSMDLANELPLAGIKILDFMWAVAGPAATRQLSDYGAEVIRIESNRISDICRTIRPFQEGVVDGELSLVFHSMNAGKKMMSLNLTIEDAKKVVLDLVGWADVVTQSFTPKTLESLGLDFERIKKHNSDIIMLSTCLMGQSGPLRNFAGYGNLAAAVTGFYELTGWPDRQPAGPYSAYTDFVSPRYVATSILAALEYRIRTGRGQHIDLSQVEASMHFLTSALLNYETNGVIQVRDGNRDCQMVPHGVFPVIGDDRWIAIVAETDNHWHAICEVLGLEKLEDAYPSLTARLKNVDSIENKIAQACMKFDPFVLEELLQNHDVPTSVVHRSEDSGVDSQLLHRGHFVELQESNGQHTIVESSRILLSRTAARIDNHIPNMGRDTNQILTEILGYDDESCAQLAISGALE